MENNQKFFKIFYQTLFVIVGSVILLSLALFFVLILYKGGNYPTGSDTFAHLYKGEELYRDILQGNYYPLYDANWYNGVQMMRYWAPLPVYVIAAAVGLAGGNLLDGYLIFVGAVFFFGGLSWIFIGLKKERPFLGLLLGILWFFIPNNLYALFGEGNLPRSLSMIFLPLFFYHLYEYLHEGKYKSMKWMVFSFFLMACCHTGYAGMLALSVLLYLIFYRIRGGERRKALQVIVGVVLGYLLLGIWLYASLKGGITSTDSSEVMEGFFQSILISVNPFYRLTVTQTVFYVGLSSFIVALFGIVASKKPTQIGFLTAFLIFLLTTTPAYYILKLLPGAQYLWMLRFISIGICMILMSVLYWKTLKPFLLVLICILFVLDSIPSYPLYIADGNYTAEMRLEMDGESMLYEEAREITSQRIALIDGSSTGARGQYLLTGDANHRVSQTYGAGWQSAATAKNIVHLNEAAESGYFDYLFDRTLAMGDDTVLIKKSVLPMKGLEEAVITESAEKSGYSYMDSNEEYLLYHMDVDGNFGVVTTYHTFGIGDDIAVSAYTMPDMKEGDSSNLNDYTFEELCNYSAIYIAGFTYDDKTEAENLIRELSESGVYVIIYGDGIPADEETRTNQFLGVSAQTIEFENGYPFLYYKGEKKDPQLFDASNREWLTVYLNGLTNTTGYIDENGLELSYLGTGENDHLIFVGLNLSYHYALTHDEVIGGILSDAIGSFGEELPDREIVPLDITIEADGITIFSEYDNVNTTLAYHDMFEVVSEEQEGGVTSSNQLLQVGKGTTVIRFTYPYLKEGLMIEIIAVLLTIIFLYRIRKIRLQVEKMQEGEAPSC